MAEIMSYKAWLAANKRETGEEAMYAYLVYLQNNGVIP